MKPGQKIIIQCGIKQSDLGKFDAVVTYGEAQYHYSIVGVDSDGNRSICGFLVDQLLNKIRSLLETELYRLAIHKEKE